MSEDYSRVWFGSWFLLGVAFFIIFRNLVARMVRNWAMDGRLERRAVIVGGGENAENPVQAVLPGALIPVLIDDDGPNGQFFSASEHKK